MRSIFVTAKEELKNLYDESVIKKSKELEDIITMDTKIQAVQNRIRQGDKTILEIRDRVLGD